MVFNTSLSERNPVLRVRDVWERTNATVADFKLVVPSTSMPLIPFSTHGSATVRNSRHLDARHKHYKWKSTSFPGSCFYPGNEVEWKAVRAVFKWPAVESNYVIAIATLSYWLAQVFQPMRSKSTTTRTMYAWFFPRFERVADNC